MAIYVKKVHPTHCSHLGFTNLTFHSQTKAEADPIAKAIDAINVPKSQKSSSDGVSRRAKFEGVFELIRNELLEYFATQGMPEDAIAWYKRVSSCHEASF